MTVLDFLSFLRSQDVQLWIADEQLRCSAPEGVLTPRLRAEITERKAEIITFLRGAKSVAQLAPIPPAPRDQALPLSPLQQRLLAPDQLELGDPAYNIPVAVRLTGLLDVAALGESINQVIQRHEALRTTFAEVNRQWVQIIAPAFTLTLPVVNVQESETEQLAAEEARRSFNLTSGPLLRASLLRMGPEEHVLLLTLHHIISDDWSIGILVRELAALYPACCTGEPSPLAPLPIQFADYAAWQRQWLQDQVLETRLAYWKERLGDVHTSFEFPTDRPRQPVQTFRGERRTRMLSPALTQSLRALSKQQDGTLFMTLLAAFKALLYGYTGQTDIVIGLPIANRNRPEIEGLIGFFVNTIVLRTDLRGAGDPTFPELLARVREVTLEAYAYQDLPFERLVEALRPMRGPGWPALFHVFFNMLNFSFGEIKLPGLIVRPFSALVVGSPAIGGKFDLTLYAIEHKECIQLDLYYNADLYAEATAVRLLERFSTMLQGIATDPDQRLSALERAGQETCESVWKSS